LPDATAQTILAHHDLTIHPEKRAAKVAMLERAMYWEQVWDLVSHVPEAQERKEVIEKLIALRIAAKQWPRVWGCGLRTSEIKWQVAMHEKYGHDSNQWPKAEIAKREREREAENKASPKPSDSPKVEALAPALAKAMNEPETRDMIIEQARKRVGAIRETTESATGKLSLIEHLKKFKGVEIPERRATVPLPKPAKKKSGK
jgi:hypothetical protein